LAGGGGMLGKKRVPSANTVLKKGPFSDTNKLKIDKRAN